MCEPFCKCVSIVFFTCTSSDIVWGMHHALPSHRLVTKQLMPLVLLLVFLSDSTQVILNEGMPHHRQPFEKGNLVIKFDVEFPSNGFISGDKLKVCV